MTYMAATEVQVHDQVLEADGFQWLVANKEYRTAKTVRFFLVPVEAGMCVRRPEAHWATFKRSTPIRVESGV